MADRTVVLTDPLTNDVLFPISINGGTAYQMIGMILPFAGSQPPTGFLLCNGQAVSRTTYPVLFQKLGTTWGEGDGSTTFNLPDLRGKVGVGVSPDYALAATGGSATVTLTSAQSGLPAHNHSGSAISAGAHSHSIYGNLVYGRNASSEQLRELGREDSSNTGNSYSAGAHTHTLSINNNTAANASEAHSNMQPYAVVNYVIIADGNKLAVGTSPTMQDLNIYSTSEQVIGTWVDGKPLYGRYIDYGTLPNNISVYKNHNIANVKHIHIEQGNSFWTANGTPLSENNGTWSYWLAPYSNQFVTALAINDNQIYVSTTGDASSYKLYLYVKYTKTTD